MADSEKDEVKMHMLPAEEKPDNEDTIDELTPNGGNKGDKPSPTKIDSADLEQVEIQAEEDDDDDDDADVQDTRPKSYQDYKAKGRNMFFKDGKRRIDYILAWKTTGKPIDLEESSKARAIFEKNLKKEGLHIEYDQRKGEEIYYAKIHAPWEVLTRYTEILKIKMPVKKVWV
ncbi:hypothetical protein KUTeg_006620 [Tegillarca granosa]|uniref:Anoctamin dimerisation domain-containing protein n=1 Tax=Tegillarca granosa TaxID=220873 RepID=A0ABQ9FDU9_TEGGR|nr:hypothetical protein KUTeg_006620 [Tegillarca granosa]